MNENRLEEIKRHIKFRAEDAATVHAFANDVKPFFLEVTDRFYEELLRQPRGAAKFTGGEDPIERERHAFAEWLVDLLSGRYDAVYYERRLRIGADHVQAGARQDRMIMGIEIVWQEIERRARAARVPDVDAKLRSFHKLLTLELAVMLDSYKEHYADRVRKSERSAVEEKLTRAEHLAEIGQLAASLAHEIKNPLAGISGAIQIIRDSMPADDPHQPIVTEILGQIRRLDATVKDLLQYARPTPPRLSEFSLDQKVARVLQVLREEPALRQIRVECEVVPLGVSVYADDAQIEQLIFNLLLNAAHASEDGGAIRMAVTERNDRVQLVVTDSGRGMTPDVQDRAFEPFFTTKAKGTGLGLSICRRIVEAHGGTIELQTEFDKGTTVTVELPCCAPVISPEES